MLRACRRCGAIDCTEHPARNGSTRQWRKVRGQALARDHYTCADCGNTSDLEVDHLIPLANGGTDSAVNLITRCTDCHATRHAPAQRAGGGA